MATNTDESGEPKSSEDESAVEAEPAAPDAESTDEAEDAPPMNRAERRLEAKRKKRGDKPGDPAPQRQGQGGGNFRGRGLQGFAKTQRGTNTRRSG
jgi:hypothetical protein